MTQRLVTYRNNGFIGGGLSQYCPHHMSIITILAPRLMVYHNRGRMHLLSPSPHATRGVSLKVIDPSAILVTVAEVYTHSGGVPEKGGLVSGG